MVTLKKFVYVDSTDVDIICTQGRAVVGEIKSINYQYCEYKIDRGIAGYITFSKADFAFNDSFNINIIKQDEMIMIKDAILIEPEDTIIESGISYVFVAKDII